MVDKKTSHTITRVVYKPDTQSTEEYVAIVNAPEYKKWKEGDKTVPLAEVVDSFTIFHSSTGHTGLMGQASKQQLENVFGSSKDVDAMSALLERGTEHTGKGIATGVVNQNASRGSFVDTGKSATGV